MLGAQEGVEEGGGFRVFAQGRCKAPGSAGGVAVVVEVAVVLRVVGKADEGIDGADGQGGGAVPLAGATSVSAKAKRAIHTRQSITPGDSGAADRSCGGA